MFRFLSHLFVVLLAAASSFPAKGASKLSLNKFLETVKTSNLEIQALQVKYESTAVSSKGIYFPAPMIGFMQMEDGTSKPRRGFEVNQDIPFPSKISRNLETRESEERFEHYDLLAKRNNILSDARSTFFLFWKTSEEKQLLLEKKAVLQTHINIMQPSVRSNSSMSLHFLNAESELDLIENDLIDLDRRIDEVRFKIAVFQGINPQKYEVEPEEPEISPINKINTPETFQSKAAEALVSVGEAKESEAKASWYPDFSIKVRSFEKTSMSPSTQEYMVGVTLPFVFLSKPRADVDKASALRQKAYIDLANTKIEIQNTILTSYTRAQSLLKQIRHLDQIVIPRAEKRMRLVHNLVPRDMESLQDHRVVTEALVNLKLKRLEIRQQYEETVATLARYETGESK